MKPWGFIHNGCCGLPIFNDQHSDQNEQSEQEVPNTESINKRVKELENLIARLVNDTRKGNRYNRNNNRRNSDNSSNNSDNNSSDNNSINSDNNSNDSDNSRKSINNNTNNDNRR
jgi:hypothetical protein